MQRRSERLMDRGLSGLGPVKRKVAAEEPVKLPDRSTPLSPPRRRGLFQDEAPDAVITTPPHRLAAQSPVPARDVAPSPFLLARLSAAPLALNPDENTPPRKRRHLDGDAGASVIMEDAPVAEPDALAAAAGEPAATPQQAPRREPEEAATPSTWFTPVRPSRPPRPPSGHAPSGPPPLEAPHSAPPSMPSRMPSFAQWMEECVEDEDAAPAAAPPAADPAPFASPQPARRPPPGARGGVDMTDLALLYDPVMAAAAGRSPPTPIEKILQRQQAAAEDGFEQDEFEPACDD